MKVEKFAVHTENGWYRQGRPSGRVIYTSNIENALLYNHKGNADGTSGMLNRMGIAAKVLMVEIEYKVQGEQTK